MLKDLAEHPRGRALYREVLKSLVAVFAGTADQSRETPEQRKAREMAEAFWSELPLWKAPLMSQGKLSDADIDALLARAQAL
jgi:beta-glucosidase